jgi:hypothetical protein
MKAADIRQFEQVLLHLISINRGRIEIEVLFRDAAVLAGLQAQVMFEDSSSLPRRLDAALACQVKSNALALCPEQAIASSMTRVKRACRP